MYFLAPPLSSLWKGNRLRKRIGLVTADSRQVIRLKQFPRIFSVYGKALFSISTTTRHFLSPQKQMHNTLYRKKNTKHFESKDTGNKNSQIWKMLVVLAKRINHQHVTKQYIFIRASTFIDIRYK